VGGGQRAARGVVVNASLGETLTVRRCVATDIERVTAIERISFSDPWSFETFSAALAQRHLRFLVAEDRAIAGGDAEPAVVGYVVALVMADEGEIADVAVAPAARHRGVARTLIERVAADLMREGVRSLYLEVRESNVAARALYGSMGFAQVGRRRGYYQQPSEDALLLRKELVRA
jgi:[ribosomal protein S18]-alanine N-acetyltransferase